MAIIDTIWLDPDGNEYMTHGTKYYGSNDKIERSFPGRFQGLGFSSIDAALVGAGKKQGKIYFFSGELYTRFDIAKGKCDEGYPRSIKDVWDIPFSKIDAAWSHPAIKNKYYMSNGSEYIRFSVDGKGFDHKSPISKYWRGIEFDYLDAAIQGRGQMSGKMYFISGDQYVRYDMKKSRVDGGYPKSLPKHWVYPKSWNPKTNRIQVQLMSVECIETEDSGFWGAASEDELTIIWGGLFGKKAVTGEWRLKGIDNGEKKFFPRDKSIIFDGNLSEDLPVELLVSLWDRDHGGGADDYKTAVDKALSVAAAGGAAASESVAGAVIMGIAAAAKAIGLPELVASIAREDGDDFLGEKILELDIMTRGNKDHILSFTLDGANYRVRIKTKIT